MKCGLQIVLLCLCSVAVFGKSPDENKSTLTKTAPVLNSSFQETPLEKKWVYTNSTNTTCIILQFAAQFNVSYLLKGTNITKEANFILPNDTDVLNGECGNSSQYITLGWASNTTLPLIKDNHLTFTYVMNTTSHKYKLDSIVAELVITGDQYPNASANGSILLKTNKIGWNVDVGTSYRCTNPPLYNLTGPNEVPSALLFLHLAQEEAFHVDKGDRFSAAVDCSGSEVSDSVPIIVACVLGGIVVIVLIAYLIGRRISHASGYLSM